MCVLGGVSYKQLAECEVRNTMKPHLCRSVIVSLRGHLSADLFLGVVELYVGPMPLVSAGERPKMLLNISSAQDSY